MPSLQSILEQKLSDYKLEGKSFFIFGTDNVWRQLAFYLSFHEITNTILYVLIIANAVSMALVTPLDDPSSIQVKVVHITDTIVLSIFFVEMVLRMVALGAFLGPYSYWNSSNWYRLDFLVVMGSVAGVVMEQRGFAALRGFRALRIFRAIKYFQGIHDVMHSLQSGLRLIVDNSLFMGFFFIAFGVMSVEFFQHTLSRWCVMEDSYASGLIEYPTKALACSHDAEVDGDRGSCPEGMICLKLTNKDYYYGMAHYDNTLHATLINFQISTLSGWTEHAYHLEEGEGAGAVVYCFLLIFLLNFVVVNLFVAVVGAVFSRMRDESGLKHPSLFTLHYDPKEHRRQLQTERLQRMLTWKKAANIISKTSGAWGRHELAHRVHRKVQARVSAWKIVRNRLLPVVDSREAFVVVSIFILANVCFTATDSAYASAQHKEMLKWTELAFTIIFSLEWMVRFLVVGNGSFAVFFINPWHKFDTLVMVISILTLIFGKKSVSFFRLLRVMQLAYYFEGLKPAAELLNRSAAGIPGVLQLCVFIMVSFFIFGVTGTQFLAGKIVDPDTGERMRLHFDHFLSGQLLLFQVMSGDTWEGYMRAAWHGGGVFGVFFIVIFFMYSVWVLINLFTAVVLENFETSDTDQYAFQFEQYHQKLLNSIHSHRSTTKKWSLKKQITDFLALPEQAVKKLEEIKGEQVEAMVEMEGEYLAKNNEKLKDLGARLEEQRRVEQKEEDGVLPGGTGEFSELEWNMLSDFNLRRLRRRQFYLSQNYAERVLQTDGMPQFENGQEKLKTNFPFQALVFEPDTEEVVEAGDDMVEVSLCLFGRENCFRKATLRFVSSRGYETFMLVLVVISTVSLAFEPPGEASERLEQETRSTNMYKQLRMLDWVFLGAFSQEVLLNSIAHGFWTPPWGTKKAYTSNPWNVLEVAMLVSMCVTIVFPQFKIIQVLRTLRPIRMLRKIESLRVMVAAVWGALPSTFLTALGTVVLFLLFAMLGVSLFGGKLNYCTDGTREGVHDCIGTYEMDQGYLAPRAWLAPTQTFDTVGSATLTLVEVASLASWTVPMFQAMDITDTGKQPSFMASPENAIYFVFVVVVCAFYLVNIFVAIILDRINQEMGNATLTGDQKAWVDFQKTLSLFEPKGDEASHPDPSGNGLRLLLWNVVHHPAFEPFIIFLIIVNIVLMASRHAGQPQYWTEILEATDIFFLVAYSVEAAIKITAAGSFKAHFRSSWNTFDAFVVCGSFASIILRERNQDDAAAMGAVRMFRIARVFKLMTATRGVRFIFKTLIISLPAIFNITLLSFLLLVIFTVFGKQIFGNIRYQAFLNKDANFRTTRGGLWTMFRVLTLDNWHMVADDCKIQPPYCTKTLHGPDGWHDDCGSPWVARVFFLTFFLLGVYILLNLVIAIILDNFGHIFSEDSFDLKELHLQQFDKTWRTEDVDNKQALQRYQVRNVLEKLYRMGNPLGYDVLGISGVEGRRRYAILIHVLDKIQEQRTEQEGMKKQSTQCYGYKEVMSVSSLMFIRFEHPEYLVYEQQKAWENERDLIESILAGQKIAAWMASFHTLRTLEKQFGSQIFVIHRLREFLMWQKRVFIARANGLPTPPPPVEAYARLRARQLEMEKEEKARKKRLRLVAGAVDFRKKKPSLDNEDTDSDEEVLLRESGNVEEVAVPAPGEGAVPVGKASADDGASREDNTILSPVASVRTVSVSDIREGVKLSFIVKKPGAKPSPSRKSFGFSSWASGGSEPVVDSFIETLPLSRSEFGAGSFTGQNTGGGQTDSSVERVGSQMLMSTGYASGSSLTSRSSRSLRASPSPEPFSAGGPKRSNLRRGFRSPEVERLRHPPSLEISVPSPRLPRTRQVAGGGVEGTPEASVSRVSSTPSSPALSPDPPRPDS